MRSLVLIILAAISAISPAQAKERGRLVGYVAAFEGLDLEMQQSGLAKYTQIDLAFVNPTPSGDVLAPGGLACAPAVHGSSDVMVSDAQLRALVAQAHRTGARLVASLGGAVIPGCGGDWEQLLQPAARPKLVANLLVLVDRYDLDGLDVDLEGELMAGIDAGGNYTPFVRELATALHARSKLLTAATGSYPGRMVPDGSLPYFDLIGIMSYDQVGPTWGTPGGEHSTYPQALADLTQWISKGVPASILRPGLRHFPRRLEPGGNFVPVR